MKLVWKGSTGCVLGEYDLGPEDAEFDGGVQRTIEQASREFFGMFQPGDSLVVVGDDEEETV